MNRLIVPLVLVLALAVALAVFVNRSEQPPPNPLPTDEMPLLGPVGATLLDGLGDHSMPVTSEHPDVQRWFDQGLMLTFGFNHDAAERSFLKAIELDPQCAMCWWGSALVLGPNINAGMNPEVNDKAVERVRAAQRVATQATDRERAYIDALAQRYAEDPPADRAPLDRAWADAMRGVSSAYPDDLDAATLYAESLMTLQPWDFWHDDGRPKGNTDEIVDVLESVMARHPDHAGALHLYIHAVEASDEPERGVRAADRLRGLIPGAGHLVHMPSHIYARVGRWHDAVAVNEDAVSADDAYLATCGPAPGVYPLGYVPHNHHFLWFAATMAGDSATALDAARETRNRAADPELLHVPGLEFLQNFAAAPMLAHVRFGQWDEIRGLDAPGDDLPYLQAMWHYAQAHAALRADGDIAEAREHHDALERLAAEPVLEQALWFDRYPMAYAARMAERMVAAEVALADGDHDGAIAILEDAAAAEDGLPYDEPPAWHAPVRQTLGAVLLDVGRPEAAEEAYRAELRRNRENGWSLFGLEQALRAQGDEAAADAVLERFEAAWSRADVVLVASRF